VGIQQILNRRNQVITLLSQADALFGRDFVTGGLAIGCIAALLTALYFAKGTEPTTDTFPSDDPLGYDDSKDDTKE